MNLSLSVCRCFRLSSLYFPGARWVTLCQRMFTLTHCSCVQVGAHVSAAGGDLPSQLAADVVWQTFLATVYMNGEPCVCQASSGRW